MLTNESSKTYVKYDIELQHASFERSRRFMNTYGR
jgi:hypothetical protein